MSHRICQLISASHIKNLNMLLTQTMQMISADIILLSSGRAINVSLNDDIVGRKLTVDIASSAPARNNVTTWYKLCRFFICFQGGAAFFDAVTDIYPTTNLQMGLKARLQISLLYKINTKFSKKNTIT